MNNLNSRTCRFAMFCMSLWIAFHCQAEERQQTRSMVINRFGVVAVEQPLAAQAGAMILHDGGNAIDAAVAANAVMGVVAPMMNGMGGDGDSKKTHHKYARVGFQRKSPQNNFRRLIAGPIAKGTFLVESVSYVPAHKSDIPLEIVLAVLNSKIAEWYFRLGSTNAMVSEYQFKIIPCPYFAGELSSVDAKTLSLVQKDLNNGDHAAAFDRVKHAMKTPPFDAIIRELIIELVNRIIAIERDRGTITRSERSGLASAAQPLQDLLDRLFYEMAGLTVDEVTGLEERLAQML